MSARSCGTCSMARSQDPDSANSRSSSASMTAAFSTSIHRVGARSRAAWKHVDALPKGEPPREPGKVVRPPWPEKGSTHLRFMG